MLASEDSSLSLTFKRYGFLLCGVLENGVIPCGRKQDQEIGRAIEEKWQRWTKRVVLNTVITWQSGIGGKVILLASI